MKPTWNEGQEPPPRKGGGTNPLVEFVRTQGPTAFVLLLLALLGIWGWSTDWKAPKFSSLWPAPPAGDKAEAIDVSGEGEGNGCARMFDRRRLTFPSEESVQRTGLKTQPATKRDLAAYVVANGVVEYNQNRIAHLATRVPGNAFKVLRHLGEPVKKGYVLALIESAEVGKAKADFLQYLVLVDIRKKILDGLKPSVVPERKIQEAEADLREARIRLYNAQQTLINLGMPVSEAKLAPLSEKEQIERVRLLGVEDLVKGTNLPGAEDLGPKLKEGEASSNLIPLRAPFDGIVVSRDIVEGEIVQPQQVQFTIADIGTMWVMLDVRLEDSAKLAPKQDAWFTADGVPDLVASSGKIDWISTDVDPKTRTVRVRVEVPNKDQRLRARTFGTGRIRTRMVNGVITVPEEAVQEDIQRSDAEPGSTAESRCRIVFVQSKDSPTVFESRLVETGIHDAGFVQIERGIAAGENVVTVGSHALKSELLKARIGGED